MKGAFALIDHFPVGRIFPVLVLYEASGALKLSSNAVAVLLLKCRKTRVNPGRLSHVCSRIADDSLTQRAGVRRFINGAKVRAPHGAMAMIDRLAT